VRDSERASSSMRAAARAAAEIFTRILMILNDNEDSKDRAGQSEMLTRQQNFRNRSIVFNHLHTPSLCLVGGAGPSPRLRVLGPPPLPIVLYLPVHMPYMAPRGYTVTALILDTHEATTSASFCARFVAAALARGGAVAAVRAASLLRSTTCDNAAGAIVADGWPAAVSSLNFCQSMATQTACWFLRENGLSF
jgi:hypothetical protein